MKRCWTKEEEQFLIENYPGNGVKYCAKQLNRSELSITRKKSNLGLKTNYRFSRYEKGSFTDIISRSKNFTDAARNLGIGSSYGNRQTIGRYVKKYGIDISHFDAGNYNRVAIGGKKELREILIENSTYSHTTNLKDRLYREGLKERKCEKCGQEEMWNGEKMSLILDHINGVNNDHRIENLRILCPNCNATLPTHGGKNIKSIPEGKSKVEKRRVAKERFKNKGLFDLELKGKYKQRTTERPPYEQLVKEVSESGYSATGRKHGVSDNSIRKWIKFYEKYEN